MLTHTQDCDIADFAEMESMQFVNPHDVNPLIGPASTLWATGPSQQVSSKPLNMLQSDDIQLKMEEFGDLSALLSVATPNAKLIAYTDELNTPIFDKDAFDFTGFNDDADKDIKVKVEYNAQLYPLSGALQQTPSNDNANMFLHQSQVLRDSTLVDLPSFVADRGQQNMSLDNLNLNSNITYSSSSNIPSPQDDQYSYVSSPADDQQLASPYSGHYNTKPKLNIKLNEFDFPVKEEVPSALNTPDLIEDVVNMGSEFNILDLVNNEDITVLSADGDFLQVMTNCSDAQYSPSSGSISSPSATKRPRKRRVVYDDDEDYIPPANRQSTVNFNDLDIDTPDNYSSDDSDYEVKKPPVKRAKVSKPRGRPPKRADSLSSDGSKDTELSKYRELRDKNNEASRRSRLKRKIKEQESEKEADDLREKNIKLKTQVEELEKLVNTYRKDLFNILGKSKQV